MIRLKKAARMLEPSGRQRIKISPDAMHCSDPVLILAQITAKGKIWR